MKIIIEEWDGDSAIRIRVTAPHFLRDILVPHLEDFEGRPAEMQAAA